MRSCQSALSETQPGPKRTTPLSDLCQWPALPTRRVTLILSTNLSSTFTHPDEYQADSRFFVEGQV